MHKTDAVAARLSWTGEEDAAMDSTASMDEQAFRSLYEMTFRPILAYLTGVTGRRDVAEDVLQETYCRFLTRQPAAMEATEARRYLFHIATNLLRDRWRRGEDRPAPEMAEEESSSDANLSNVNTQMDVRRAMQAMKPRERELLWLAYVEGMSHAEIAKATGLGTMSVRLLLFRARQRAAALLRPLEEQERKSNESKRV